MVKVSCLRCKATQFLQLRIRGVARSQNVGNVGDTHGERGAPRSPEPLVRGSGGEAPEAESLLAFGCPTEAANLPHSPYFANSLNPKYL